MRWRGACADAPGRLEVDSSVSQASDPVCCSEVRPRDVTGVVLTAPGTLLTVGSLLSGNAELLLEHSKGEIGNKKEGDVSKHIRGENSLFFIVLSKNC